jgi:phosphate-selective porin
MLSIKNHHSPSSRVLAAAAAILIIASMPAFAQKGSAPPAATPSPTATPTPVRHESEPVPSSESAGEDMTPIPAKGSDQPAPVDYFFSDAPPNATKYSNRFFDVRLGFAILTDYTFVFQNQANRAQVGPQASKFDLRAGRFVLSGQFKFKRPWTYVMGRDYNENASDEDRRFDYLDFYLTIPLWKKARVTIGLQKEPFIYEMVGDAANLPQQERVLSPFFISRNVGIKYQDNFLKDKISFSIGVYNDWFRKHVPFSKSGMRVSARLTGLPIESKDSREFLHLGVAFRYLGADDGQLRYKGRPESNVIDNYVNTGNIPGKHANQLALEALYNNRGFSVLTEYAHAWVASPEKGNPQFSGFYVTGSYVLTGENRPYDKKVGYARRIIPRSRWGAVEVVGRFGYVDLDDTLIKGGKMTTWYAGMNWWMSRQWKFGTGYGIADLDKLGTTGRTQRLFTRVQWIY